MPMQKATNNAKRRVMPIKVERMTTAMTIAMATITSRYSDSEVDSDAVGPA